ncbi:uncharacterized protein LOC133731044 [Rosa rugosa]|uniref:uncharacterized protein LOC133731044 n=1 Tax=Rosa rugosa TaxID=74645 RepID=UPI002B410024|nr:uncharacterized protein LOC133731044 [Rosa rugosa]
MDLDILSWNCRGICNDTTTRALKDLISQNRPQIVFLCETKISTQGAFQALHRALGFVHSEAVLSDGQSGGLGLFWNDDVNIRMGTTTVERDRSWQLLKDLADLDSLPWVVIGDFNEFLNSGEKIDGPLRSERQMRGFHEALGHGDLLDLGFQGTKSTWWNSETKLRLDRAASTVPIPNRQRIHRFKFEAFWLQHPNCDALVKEAWATDVMGVPMFVVTQKIAHTRMVLDKWQKDSFRARQQSMLGIRARLEELMDGQSTDAVQLEKQTLMSRLQSLLSQEEIFWRQRSKVQWLKEGDRNTSFFHRKASNRRRKNLIQGLYDEEGTWCEDDARLERVVSSYFTKMFTASELDFEAMETTLAAIQPRVSTEMNAQLCLPYTGEEIKCALFQMYPTKSPGPDGMPPIFFQHYWETIGEDVVEAVQSFLHTGRLITDNILVANEMAHFIHNKREGSEGFMALKLDLSKAYDRMEWVFLRKYVVNHEVDLVTPSRGLRQGDPLSPYLFLIGAEGFSALLQQKQRLGLLPGIEICNDVPVVNHLLFADDSMLYANATLEDCYQIHEVLEIYGRASGQLVNFNKSSIVFSKNVSVFVQEEVASLLGMEVVESHEKYLGLPTYVGRKKTATFQYIKENLAKKLMNWQGKLLSGAGKDILIRVVAQALPTYAMSVFQLTKCFCEDLEQMRARFWRGSTLDKRKIHWKS